VHIKGELIMQFEKTRPEREFLFRKKFVRAALKTIFAKLRKDNLICRMNYLCCMSCASYDLSEKVDNKNADGAVYFHRQDNDNFNETGRLHLRYFTRTDSGDCKALAEKVVAALKAENLPVEWDGDPTRTILIKV
jgi:hypothetical protein